MLVRQSLHEEDDSFKGLGIRVYRVQAKSVLKFLKRSPFQSSPAVIVGKFARKFRQQSKAHLTSSESTCEQFTGRVDEIESKDCSQLLA